MITLSSQCLNREKHTCLISEAAFPEACHIIPFAFNGGNENMDAAHVLISLEETGPGAYYGVRFHVNWTFVYFINTLWFSYHTIK